ncbi:uncharacterized protein [Medicago truncatula]|uniref:uncharacterized protein n=1 Tax=Medicago truncatula TaxID=3880 RepID=UPI000D2F1505|nr:uncharacterized protein LOC112422667 [Medicago truncatula]
MECVTTATASVLVNGCPTDEFHFERGLRQGDPLSPFLFLLAAEGLNVMMSAVASNGLFTSYSVGTQILVSVSHLQFADDTLLVGIKSWANVRAMKAVLLLFEAISGLKVNFHKSMLFGVNITESWLHEAAVVMHCRHGRLPFIYLGLPIGGDPRKLIFWYPLVERIRRRLSRWKSKNLSLGGKWVWRVLEDKESLWNVVLRAKYGEFGGRVRFCEGVGSIWWRQLNQVRAGVGLVESTWLVDNIGRKVDIADRWVWRLHSSQVYTVHSAYSYLTAVDTNITADFDQFLWLKAVPLKVNIFVWRLFLNRLATKDNLRKRNILEATNVSCGALCGNEEDMDHLFFQCNYYGRLWLMISDWLGFVTVLNGNLYSHAHQFCALGGFSKNSMQAFTIIWISVLYTI